MTHVRENNLVLMSLNVQLNLWSKLMTRVCNSSKVYQGQP